MGAGSRARTRVVSTNRSIYPRHIWSGYSRGAGVHEVATIKFDGYAGPSLSLMKKLAAATERSPVLGNYPSSWRTNWNDLSIPPILCHVPGKCSRRRLPCTHVVYSRCAHHLMCRCVLPAARLPPTTSHYSPLDLTLFSAHNESSSVVPKSLSARARVTCESTLMLLIVTKGDEWPERSHPIVTAVIRFPVTRVKLLVQ